MKAMTTSVDIERLVLKYGSHKEPVSGGPIEACFNEAVSLRAGEPWSDNPACVCPTIRAVTMRFNDRCGSGDAADERRTRILAPLELVVIGTRGSKELAHRRSWLGVDWSWRAALPRILSVTSLGEAWLPRFAAIAPIVDGFVYVAVPS